MNRTPHSASKVSVAMPRLALLSVRLNFWAELTISVTEPSTGSPNLSLRLLGAPKVVSSWISRKVKPRPPPSAATSTTPNRSWRFGAEGTAGTCGGEMMRNCTESVVASAACEIRAASRRARNSSNFALMTP